MLWIGYTVVGGVLIYFAVRTFMDYRRHRKQVAQTLADSAERQREILYLIHSRSLYEEDDD